MKLRHGVLGLFLSLLLFPGCSKKCKPGEDVDCWIKALEDPERLDKAIDNVKQLGDKKAESALIEAFQVQTTTPQHKEKIAEIFKKWRTPGAVKPMLAAINYSVGPNKDGRKAKRTNRANQKIASALGFIGDKQAVGPLMRLMKTTKEATVRRAAIRALGNLKASEAVDELIRLSEDPNTHKIVRMNAVFALGEIGHPKAIDSLILCLYRDKAYFFFQAGLALVKIGEPAIQPLVKTMFGKNQEANKITQQSADIMTGALESNAAKVLGDIGSPKAVTPLLKLATKLSKWENEANRMLVMTRLINALGTIGDKRGLEVPLKHLDKELWDLRTICANAINSISQRSAVTNLLKQATTGQHPRTRVPLIEAIGNLGTNSVLEKLQGMYRTQRDLTVNKAVQESIKRVKAYAQCKKKVECWTKNLRSNEAAVREKAAYELGRLGARQAITPLIQIIADPSEDVRFAVIWALNRLKVKDAIEPIEKLVETEKGSTRYKVVNFNYRLLAARLSRIGK